MALLRNATVVALAGMLWSNAARAEDDKNLSILPFSGARSQQFHDRVEKALGIWGYRIADDKKAPAPGASESEFKAYAERHHVQVMVSGNVTNDSTAWILDLQIRSGLDGRLVSSLRLTSPWMPGLLRRVEKETAKSMRLVIAEIFDPQQQANTQQTAVAKDSTEASESSSGSEAAVLNSASNESANVQLAAAESASRSKSFVRLMATLDDEPEAEKHRVPGLAPVSPDLSIGLRGGYLQRKMTASDTQNPQGEFRGQDGAFPTLAVSTGAYLGIFDVTNGWRNLGLEGEFEQSLGGSASFELGAQESTSVSTTLTSFLVGPRLRIPLSAKRLEVGARLQAGKQRMALGFDANPSAAPERSLAASGVGGVPDVNYSFIRAAGDGKIRFGAFSIDGEVGYRLVTNPGNGPGEIAGDVNAAGEPAFFPNDIVTGADGNLTLGYELFKNLELLVGADARLYVHDFNFTPSSQLTLTTRRPVASGATDAYYRASLGIAWAPVL